MWRATMTSLRLPEPAAPDRNNAAPVGANDDLGVGAAAVVLADGGDRLVVYRDERVVDDPCPAFVAVVGCEHHGQQRDQVVDDAVHRRLADVKQCGERSGGQVGAELAQHQQHPHEQGADPKVDRCAAGRRCRVRVATVWI